MKYAPLTRHGKSIRRDLFRRFLAYSDLTQPNIDGKTPDELWTARSQVPLHLVEKARLFRDLKMKDPHNLLFP